MRIAALYDIHGNIAAFEAVLAEIERERIEEIVVGGDVVPGPFPAESLARLRALDIPWYAIRGNGDREVAAAREGKESEALPPPVRELLRWNADRLGADDHAQLAAWPMTLHMAIAGLGTVFFCHATPASDTEIFTKRTAVERIVALFDEVDAELIVCGHTHMQFDLTAGGRRIVNAGSVGMPFGEPGAHWLLLGPDVTLRRTPYDLDAAAAHVRTSGYPQAEEFAAQNILDPPSEAQMLDLFTQAESER